MWKRLHTNVNGKEIRGVEGGDIKGTYGEAVSTSWVRTITIDKH